MTELQQSSDCSPTNSYHSTVLNSTARTNWTVKVRVTLRLAVYRQSVLLRDKPLETHDNTFFATEPLRSESLCNILSDDRMGLSLMNMLGLSSNVIIAHIEFYWKFFILHYIHVLCEYRLCKPDRAYLTYLMLQRQFSHLDDGMLDHRQVWASYIFYIWLRHVLYCEHVHSHDFAWLLFVARTIFYIIVYIRKVERRVQIADQRASWKSSNCAETLLLKALQF
jgi:hypothetical protein